MADGVSWIKLSIDIFNNKKIKQIRKLPEGDAIIGIWLQVLCLAGSINDGGSVYFTQDLPYSEEMLSVEFDRPIQTMKLALKTFVTFEMIEIVNNILLVSNWEKYQNVEGLEKIRESNRNRQQRFRDNQNAQKPKFLEDKVTLRNVTECDYVTFPSISISSSPILNSKVPSTKGKKPKPEPVSFDTVISEFTDNEDLSKVIKAFIEFRESKGWDLTQYALELILKKIKPYTDEQRIKFIETSIERSYRGVFIDDNKQPKPAFAKKKHNDIIE